MESWWDKIRPFVLSFGMHAAVLLLLVADFSQRPAAHAHVGRGSLINASLVAWPSAGLPAAGIPTPQLHAAVAATRPTPRTPVVQQPDKAVPKPPKPASSEKASAAKPDRPTAPPAPDVPPVDVSLQPDQDDPYAQMRRERAEAERRYQLEQAAIKRGEEADAQQAQAAQPTAGTQPDAAAASAPLPFDSQDSDAPGANAFLAGLQFNAGSAVALAQGEPWTQCQANSSTPGNGDADALAWIDCLLDPWQTAPEGPDPKGATSWPVRLSE